MESLKIDKTKLKTVRHFAASKNLTVQQIYNWIKSDKVKCVVIDGVKFIEV